MVNVEHNEAGMGALSVAAYSQGGIDLFQVTDCQGVDGAYYPDHILSLLKRNAVMDATWEGQRMHRSWDEGDALFIPADSFLTHTTRSPYDETVIRLKDELFVKAAREHVDFSQIDFSFQKVTSFLTLGLGLSLAGIVMDKSYSHWPMLIETAALSLVLAVIRELSPHSTTAFKEIHYGLSSAKRRRVLAYIHDNIGRQITLSELAEVANLSVYHFSRKFKNALGETPIQYVAARRVDAAKHQLRATGESLVGISMACGFASQSHFNTVFKQVTGVTPGAYRFQA